jgi:translation elongation factor EF-1alpha
MATSETIALIEHRISSIEESHMDLKDAIKELTNAIHKLAIIDERQIQSAITMDKLSAATDKAHSRIDGLTSEFAKALEKAKEENQLQRAALEVRLSNLEKTEPIQKKTTEWVEKVQWLIVGTVITALVAVVVVRP